jgi:nitrogen-specific signal transduction histidine kinase
LEGVSADYEIKYGERSYDAHVEPLKKVDGTVIGTMGIARDITDLVKVREQFFFAQKMEAVGRLAGGVAHDINNLLTAIMGYADILKKGMGEDDPLLRHVEAIGRASQRGEVMISQLMAYGRRRVSRPVDTDIGHWLESIEDFVARLVRDDIVLSVEGESGKHVACVDVVQLEQVILNLAVNAVDVMPNGGTLALGVRGVDVGAQEMDAYRVAAVGPYVCIEVSDDGGGIPEEIQGQIFEPFFTTKGVAEGTGLGLSTAFAIVHEAGGGVSFETEQGVGTTFRVCLPQASAFTESAVKEGEAVPMVPVGQARIILLVEDDEMVRVMVKDVLSNAGFKVMEAHYGPAALALSRQWGGSIDLLVTDVVMPRLSGPELASTLREEYPGLKVLFMSGHTGEAVKGELEDGMAFIAKPFHPDAFLGEVNGLLQPALSTVNVEKED